MARPLVVLVEMALAPGQGSAFIELVRENAAASLRDEPGCRQFDVLVPDDGAPDRVLLYEIYDDEGAFEAHLKTAHYASFAAATGPLVRSKTITRLTLAAAG